MSQDPQEAEKAIAKTLRLRGTPAPVAQVSRRALLIGLAAVFTLGNLMAAVSTDYAMLLVARVVTSLNHGAFFGVGSIVAASLVPPNRQAGAVAAMFMGLTIATVVGVPLAAWAGDVLGWRASFWAIAGIGLPLLMGAWTPLTAMSSLLAVWIVASGVFQIIERMKTGQPSASFWGMHIAHFGIAVFVFGVAMVGGYQEEKDIRMEPGDTVQVGGYGFRLIEVNDAPGPNYRAAVGSVELSKDGRVLKTMYPEKRQYFSSQMPMTEAAIDAGFTRDVYVSLGEPLGDKGAWSVRVYFKPFVDWIWAGCLLMGLGGFVAMLDRRYRLRLKVGAGVTAGVAA